MKPSSALRSRPDWTPASQSARAITQMQTKTIFDGSLSVERCKPWKKLLRNLVQSLSCFFKTAAEFNYSFQIATSPG
jgi:hypothetical protein